MQCSSSLCISVSMSRNSTPEFKNVQNVVLSSHIIMWGSFIEWLEFDPRSLLVGSCPSE